MDTTFLAHKQHIKGCQIPWIKLKGVLPNKNHSFKPFTATPIAHCTPTCDQHITCIYPPMISLLTHHHVIPAKSRRHIQQSPRWDIHPWTLTPPLCKSTDHKYVHHNHMKLCTYQWHHSHPISCAYPPVTMLTTNFTHRHTPQSPHWHIPPSVITHTHASTTFMHTQSPHWLHTPNNHHPHTHTRCHTPINYHTHASDIPHTRHYTNQAPHTHTCIYPPIITLTRPAHLTLHTHADTTHPPVHHLYTRHPSAYPH